MSQFDDSPLGGDVPDAFVRDEPPAIAHPPLAETTLTLDDILTQAKRPERRVRICLAGDLLGELDEVEAQIEELVDDEGQPIVTDDALNATTPLAELVARAKDIRSRMLRFMRTVTVQAMPSAQWPTFFEAYLDQKYTDGFKPEFWDKLVEECAIAPKLDAKGVAAFREALGHAQFRAVANAAFNSNSKAGIDIPKSPASLEALTRAKRF